MQNKGVLEISIRLYWMLSARGGSHGFGQNKSPDKCWTRKVTKNYNFLEFWGLDTIPPLQHRASGAHMAQV